MKLDDMIKSLQIVQHYYDDQNGHVFDAQHDELRLYPTDKPMLPIDVENMKRYGWFQEEHDEDSTYDPDTGWMCFV